MVKIDQDLDTDSERYVYNYLQSKELSPESTALLDIMNKIHDQNFKYRKLYNYEHSKYNLLTWDSGFLQIYKMCFSRDALPAAKLDNELQKLYEEFKAARKVLGDKIAYRYSEDTGF